VQGLRTGFGAASYKIALAAARELASPAASSAPSNSACSVAVTDPYHLDRFVRAQNEGGIYQDALAELRRGRKTSHWMWFVFPQIAGLGQSQMSRLYAIASLDEAQAYLSHPTLGPRLREVAAIVAASSASSAAALLGGIDAQKLRSSMTLFLRADPSQPVFQQVLDCYFQGGADPATDQLLAKR
jgi:uncharacterized protein (DUF1810 family)